MALKTLPPRNLVRRLLDYDPDTGLFIWRRRPREMFPDGWNFEIWNNRFAGKPAGTPIAGYLQIGIHNAAYSTQYRAHRLAWLLVHGEPVPDQLDHIDRNRANNRINNLRPATQSQSSANTSLRSNNTTGIKGVSRHQNGFRVEVSFAGKRYRRLFRTMEEAIKARRDAVIEMHGDFASID